MKLIPLPLALLAMASIASAGGPHAATAAPNGTPVGVDDAFEVVQDTRLDVDAPGLLANDSDPDGDPILNGFHSNPANGTILAMPQDGSFVYEPDPGFVGVDTFQYSVQDDQGNFTGLVPVVTITVIANRPPVGVDDAFEVAEGETLPVAVPGLLANDSDPDGDPIEVRAASSPSNGTLSISPAGSFQYTPDPGFSGVDGFLYAVDDDQGNSTGLVVEVVITVTPSEPPSTGPNDPPVGVDDDFEVVQDTTLEVAAPGVLANDSDPDGDPIEVPSASTPANGTLTMQRVGSFQYTPDPGFTGVDTFRYAVEDDQGNTTGVSVVVTITVTPSPDPTTIPANGAPIGVDDAFAVVAGETLDVAVPGVLANDSDPEGDPIEVPLITETANGDIVADRVGSFQYTPDPGFTGEDTFLYEVADDQGNSSGLVVRVVITVTPTTDPASTDPATTDPATGDPPTTAPPATGADTTEPLVPASEPPSAVEAAGAELPAELPPTSAVAVAGQVGGPGDDDQHHRANRRAPRDRLQLDHCRTRRGRATRRRRGARHRLRRRRCRQTAAMRGTPGSWVRRWDSNPEPPNSDTQLRSLAGNQLFLAAVSVAELRLPRPRIRMSLM